jgi:hypothetical protein
LDFANAKTELSASIVGRARETSFRLGGLNATMSMEVLQRICSLADRTQDFVTHAIIRKHGFLSADVPFEVRTFG